MKPTSNFIPNKRKQLALESRLILAAFTIMALIMGYRTFAHAETYVVNGTKGQTKVDAMKAAYNDPKAKIERCKFKEKKNSNEGEVQCRSVEIGSNGTLVLQK